MRFRRPRWRWLASRVLVTLRSEGVRSTTRGSYLLRPRKAVGFQLSTQREQKLKLGPIRVNDYTQPIVAN
jgi:hypothetical protein